MAGFGRSACNILYKYHGAASHTLRSSVMCFSVRSALLPTHHDAVSRTQSSRDRYSLLIFLHQPDGIVRKIAVGDTFIGDQVCKLGRWPLRGGTPHAFA